MAILSYRHRKGVNLRVIGYEKFIQHSPKVLHVDLDDVGHGEEPF